MEEYILSCCSTADMPKEFFEERKISYVCFHYFMDGVEYPDDLGQSMPFQQFYKKMQASLLNISDHFLKMEKIFYM